MSKNYTLGLDLGTNSIGWALLVHDTSDKPAGYLDGGVRIFPKAVEDKTPTPKSANRRAKRLARRLIERRMRRKRRLENLLISKGLLPAALRDDAKREQELNNLGDPYALRAKALDERLAPLELGRVLLHLVQRRGFQSNRKTLFKELIDDPDAADLIEELDKKDHSALDEEESAFKKDIARLGEEIAHAGKRTLGEYLGAREAGECRRNRQHNGGFLRTSRDMYRDELVHIRARQAAYFSGTLSNEDWAEIESIIFYQRPLRLKAGRLGACEFESKRPRAHRARLEYQRFRYLQDINHLEYFEAQANGYIRLSDEQRSKLAEALERNPEMSWAKVRKLLGLDRSQKFNLEQNEVKKLKGNHTACAIRAVLGSRWDEMGGAEQAALVEDLITIHNKKVLKERLVTHWGFDADKAVHLALLVLEPDHASLSLKAIRRFLPHLEKGLIYTDALQAAGYQMRKQKVSEAQIVDRLPPPPDARNPVVNKALHELRKLVNAIIKRYGKPAAIRLEMARELKMNQKRLAAFRRQQNANTRANDTAREAFMSHHQHARPSRDDLIKYRLWKDQDGVCAYSGAQIALSQLFSDLTEVDHIYPFKQSLDDSYLNKVVAFTAENRIKGNRTPWQAFSADAARWEQIVQRAKHWADKGRALKGKAERMLYQGEVNDLDAFINSQLVDTRYMSRLALDYLKPLGCDVSVVKGQITAWLRHIWGLSAILGKGDEKNRADHRHHLIDAAVVAVTDRNLYRQMAHLAQRDDVQGPDDIALDPPWEGFMEATDALVAGTIVSYVPAWKISGALHEDTASGVIVEPNGSVRAVYRKRLLPDFKPKDVEAIVDPVVQEAVRSHIAAFDGDAKRAFAPGFELRHPNGSRIHRVRIYRTSKSLRSMEAMEAAHLPVRDRHSRPFRFMNYGNTHHVEIFRHRETGRYKGRFVTMWAAAARARRVKGEDRPIIDRDYDEKHEFVAALAINDMVRLGNGDIYRVQNLEKDDNRITLRPHMDATSDKKSTALVRKTTGKLFDQHKLEKIVVDRLGHLAE